MTVSRSYLPFIKNKEYLSLAKSILEKIQPDKEVVKANDLEDILITLRRWEIDTFLTYIDSIDNKSVGR